MRRLKLIHLTYFLPVLTLVYLFWQNTKPVLTINYDLAGKTALAGELVPTSRVGGMQTDVLGKYREILEEPVYFDVRLPRKYDIVTAEVEYSDLGPDIFELGVSRDLGQKSFDFFSLENKILDNLAWTKIEENNLVLYERKPDYKTIAGFLQNPGDFDETLAYRAGAQPVLKNLKFYPLGAKGETVIDFPIVGGLKLAVYHQGGILKIVADADEAFKVRVFNEFGEEAQTDKGLPAGIYIVNIAGGENTVFNSIFANSPYVAILDKITLGKLARPLDFYFAGSRLLMTAKNAAGAQAVGVNGKITDVSEVLAQYQQIFDNIKLRSLKAPKGNIELDAAIFFINNKNIFYPRFENFYPGVNLSGINYILANYAGSAVNGGIKTAAAEFDIADTPLANGKLRFLLSLPNAEKGELVKIRSIKLTFTGKSFSLADIFKKIFRIGN